MEKIAICIPTYNRGEVIEELLVKCGQYITELGYDLYIFDSSEDDSTEEICRKYKDKYIFNYKRIDSSVHSNAKVYMIYQDSDLIYKYNYIWVWSDAIRWSRKVLEDIKKYKEYDFVIMHCRDNIGNREYSDIQAVFQDLAWVVTLYGTAIVNTDTVLKQVDWKRYESKYLVSQRINFSHVCLYYERMAEMKSVRVRHVSVKSYEFTQSPLKKSSGWKSEIFNVWWNCWYDAIMSLPDVYINKKQVIKKHGIYSAFFTFKGMLRLRIDNKYRLSVFFKYINRITFITNVSVVKMLGIAIMPRSLAKCILEKPQRKLINDLKEFIKKYPIIYIYGCGCNARIVAEYMQSHGMEYAGFCVSQISNNNDGFMGKRVIEYSDSLLENSKVGIVLGMNEKNSLQVLNAVFSENEKRARVFNDFNNYWEILY